MDNEDVCAHTHTYTHTIEYYSAVKNERMPSVTTWINTEIIILR